MDFDVDAADIENIIAISKDKRPLGSDRPLLVVVVNFPPSGFNKSIWDALAAIGLDCVIINNVEFVAVVDAPQTFFTAKNKSDRGIRVLADGVELQRVLWVETTTGLVCMQEIGTLNKLIKRFASLSVEKKSAHWMPNWFAPNAKCSKCGESIGNDEQLKHEDECWNNGVQS